MKDELPPLSGGVGGVKNLTSNNKTLESNHISQPTPAEAPCSVRRPYGDLTSLLIQIGLDILQRHQSTVSVHTQAKSSKQEGRIRGGG